MKTKPKEIMVNLPAAHLFQSEDEMAAFASAINTIVHGKVKVKYEILGTLGGQYVGLFYIQRNLESQEIHDEFIRLIEQEEMHAIPEEEYIRDEKVSNVMETHPHSFCLDCDEYMMLHQKGEDHCVCGETWNNGCKLYQK